jgi:tetratricopeptide (TPR) repeat protein
MSLRIACLLAVLTWSGMATAVDVEQSTGGPCSPAINGNHNTVNCSGVDPRAMKWLLDELDRKNRDLDEKIAEANEWARKYKDLDAQLTDARRQLEAKGEDATLVQTAQRLLHEGKLDEARKIYDRLITSDEANVDRAAENHYVRANIFSLEFRMTDALRDYAQAYQYRPDNLQYAIGYAGAAFRERQYSEAEMVLTAALQLSRDLAARDPSNQSQVAKTLNSLGVLYTNTGRPAEAEKAYREALPTYRDLAARDPATYRPMLAMVLENLGNLYTTTGRYAEGEKILTEALTIYSDLAIGDPRWRPYFAGMLVNLGNLYTTVGRYPEAEKTLTEALKTYRDLDARASGAYRPGVASTLNDLGNLYASTGRPDEAEKAYKEALAIRRDLAARDPAYLPDVARTQNNLGFLYSGIGRRTDAEEAYCEALPTYRDQASKNPRVWAVKAEALTKRLAALSTTPCQTRP